MFDNNLEIFWLIGLLAGLVIRSKYVKECKPKKSELELDMFLVILASVGMIILPLLYVLTPWLDFANYHLPQNLGCFGVTIFIIALWLIWRSHVNLGDNFSLIPEIKEKHTLVTKGVYEYIRHPMYAAHWLWAIAQALLLQNWIAGLAMLILFFPLYSERVLREEKMMVEEFGDEYRNYMKKTGRIIPRLTK